MHWLFLFLFFSVKAQHTEYVSGKNDLEIADGYTDIPPFSKFRTTDGQMFYKSTIKVYILTENSVLRD